MTLSHVTSTDTIGTIGQQVDKKWQLWDGALSGSADRRLTSFILFCHRLLCTAQHLDSRTRWPDLVRTLLADTTRIRICVGGLIVCVVIVEISDQLID